MLVPRTMISPITPGCSTGRPSSSTRRIAMPAIGRPIEPTFFAPCGGFHAVDVQLGHAAPFRHLDAESRPEALLQGDGHGLSRGEAEVQAAEVAGARPSRFSE